MTPEQREMLRINLLTIARPAATYGKSLEVFRVFLRARGIQATDDEIQEELQYNVEKGFLSVVPKQISPENTLWKITAAGRDLLATQNL